MAIIQQYIQECQRVKARRLRNLLAGGGEPSGARPSAGSFSDMLRQSGGARAASEDGGADSVDLWDLLEREAARGSAQELKDDAERDGEDLEELINDAERALIGDLGNDFDDLNARWREIAAAREAKESIPRPTKKAHLLHQMARLWDELEINAKPSRLDDRGSEPSSHGRRRGFGSASASAFGPAFGFGSKQPDAPFTEEDWRRLGDSVLRPPGGSGQWAASPAAPAVPATPASPVAPSIFASHQPPSSARCCACGAPLAGGQACNAGARCGACVAAGAFCARCGAALCRPGPCHGCGPGFCVGAHAPAVNACGLCARNGTCHRNGACPCNGGCAACARKAGCSCFVGAVGATMGRGKPARQRDSKGRWLPNFPAPGMAASMSGERGRVGTILRGSLPSRCALGDRDRRVSASAQADSSGGAGTAFDRPTFDGADGSDRVDSSDSRDEWESCGDRNGERRSRPTNWRPMFWLLALMLVALGLAVGGALQAH